LGSLASIVSGYGVRQRFAFKVIASGDPILLQNGHREEKVAGERVAVIGGAGNLGSQIVLQLLQAGYAPVVVARRPEKAARVLSGIQVETRRGDVTDLESLRVALKGCTYAHSTVALVNQVFMGATRAEEDEVVRTNLEGTLNVLRAAHEQGIKRVILTGSCSLRYTRAGTMAHEDSPPTDLELVSDPYVRSKLQAELAASEFAQETGLQVVHILPGALIGPPAWEPALLNEEVLKRLNGDRMPMVDGRVMVVDVRDVARAHAKATEVEPARQAYLLVADTISMRKLYGLITQLGGTPPLAFMSPKIAMAFALLAEVAAGFFRRAPLFNRNAVRHVSRDRRFDCSRAQRELGVAFTPIETTVCELVQWFLDNGFVSNPEALRSRVSGRPTAE
jgi:dihydroflavonol-4-reductase